MLTFHEYNNGMTVMDGKQIVAMARERLSSGWLLHLNGASWLDHRARIPGRITRVADPSYLLVKTRHEAAIIMLQLRATGRNPN